MNHWKGSKVLCTGAGGFIGSHLAERLTREGAKVRAFVRYNALGSRGWLDRSEYAAEMEIVAGDIRDRDSVQAAMKGCDTVYHLAAVIAIPFSYGVPGLYVQTNVTGTLNVLQCARDAGVQRLVHTSTSEVYGSAVTLPMSESHPIRPQSPYASSKVAADALARSFWCSYGTPVVTLRPFNVFGCRQSTRAIIPTIISQLLDGDVVRLGNPDTTRDWNYVENTVDAFLLAGSTPGIEGRVINIGSGIERSVRDVAVRVASILGRDLQIVTEQERMRPANSEVTRLVCDSTLARRLLGWEPRVSFGGGLERTIEWMRAHEPARAGEYRV